jgi:hypothetical protein
MSDREDLTRREAAGWDELRAVVDAMTPEQREAPTATDEGWSVKDVLWHVAFWWDDLSRMLEELADRGSFTEASEDDAVTDAVNAQTLEISRSMRLAEVEAGVERARLRLLRAWAALPEVGEDAAQWFVWETVEHYEEHLPHVRRAAAGAP